MRSRFVAYECIYATPARGTPTRKKSRVNGKAHSFCQKPKVCQTSMKVQGCYGSNIGSVRVGKRRAEVFVRNPRFRVRPRKFSVLGFAGYVMKPYLHVSDIYIYLSLSLSYVVPRWFRPTLPAVISNFSNT